MKMKTRNKIMLLALCMAALIAVSVLGTMAYLTSTDTVTNTFTVGKVDITLDEAKVDTDGKALTGGQASRVDENTYKLMPGHTYTKDPTVHVTAGSENSWIFVKVENGIAGFEATSSTEENGNKTIAEQITKNGWIALPNNTGVYYKEYTQSNATTDYIVFSNFKIADNANTSSGWDTFDGNVTKVIVTAYAIQKDGFTNVTSAWTALSESLKGN